MASRRSAASRSTSSAPAYAVMCRRLPTPWYSLHGGASARGWWGGAGRGALECGGTCADRWACQPAAD